MDVRVDVAYDLGPKVNTLKTQAVKDSFGIDFEIGRRVIVDGLKFTVEPGSIVMFTGESGSGKSSAMREAGRQLGAVDIDGLDLGDPDAALVDLIPGDVKATVGLLSQFGLAEAFLMLRRVSELSDGQRYRFRLAKGWSHGGALMADEFTANLDRITAKTIAANLRKQQLREPERIWLVATTHQDIIEDLQPDVLVDLTRGEVGKGLPGGGRSALRLNSTSPPGLRRTGRSLLGGITSGTASASS